MFQHHLNLHHLNWHYMTYMYQYTAIAYTCYYHYWSKNCSFQIETGQWLECYALNHKVLYECISLWHILHVSSQVKVPMQPQLILWESLPVYLWRTVGFFSATCTIYVTRLHVSPPSLIAPPYNITENCWVWHKTEIKIKFKCNQLTSKYFIFAYRYMNVHIHESDKWLTCICTYDL